MAKASSRGMLVWLGLAAAIVLLDQASKGLILALFRPGEVLPVTSFFNLVRVHNPGAAFSFLAGAGGWQRWLFLGIGLVAVAVILWLLRAHHQQKLFAFSLACLLGGALGNVIDRALHGYVVDMLDVHHRWLAPLFAGGHYPAFNVADMAITAGAIGLIVDELRRVRRSR
ncbi:MAG: signal peptidase II [Tepidimonas ignava]|uniref:Lipoprotein signal peptidase n=1 Tax=Tepidimonas ignava TaxID=114249 RepID=A0A4R3L8E1_9BURK|nr:signal peptidase II [Tepidimonas ignava]MCX7815650.1 signal peptidase II [Tepidimonas ignava]TCS95300.1 signal peptidase II [Tepidimonas ignava]TSE19761.1 Lipoprotein signal peptidase [Tepidimonas ignava]